MLIDTYMKFREDSLNGFEVTEGHDFVTESKGHNSKKYKTKNYGSCAMHVV